MSEVTILVFGQLKEIVKEDKLTLNNFTDTHSLIAELNRQYPAFVKANHLVAVDKHTVTANTALTDGNTLALMPPFSGG